MDLHKKWLESVLHQPSKFVYAKTGNFCSRARDGKARSTQKSLFMIRLCRIPNYFSSSLSLFSSELPGPQNVGLTRLPCTNEQNGQERAHSRKAWTRPPGSNGWLQTLFLRKTKKSKYFVFRGNKVWNQLMVFTKIIFEKIVSFWWKLKCRNSCRIVRR